MKVRLLVSILLAVMLLISGCGENDIKKTNTTEDGHISENKDQQINQNSNSQIPTIKDIMEKLASDEFKGRLPGTEGNEKAASYIANIMRKLQLETYKNDSYYHTYQQEVYDPDKSTSTFIVEFQDGSTKEYKYGKDYIEQVRMREIDLDLELTFDSDDEDISQKIAVIDRGSLSDSKVREAKGLLVSKDVFFGNALIRDSGLPMIQITKEVHQELQERNARRAKIEFNQPTEEKEVKNVVGIIPGKDSSKALVLSAHFDHVGWAGETVFNGAVDNASGTTVILDLARKLKEHSIEKPFDMDILVVAFNGEEGFLKGSQAFVKDLGEYDNVYNINIDCVGKKDGGKLALGQDNQLNFELAEELKKVFEKNDVQFSEEYYGCSDNASFSTYYPAVAIGQENLTDKSCEYIIHTPEDTVDKIDFEYLEKISDAVYKFILANDSKVFCSENRKDNENTSISSNDEEEVHEVYMKAQEIKKEMNLKYDEKVALEIDGYHVSVTGNRLLDDLESVKKYYPDLKLPEKIKAYSFIGAYICLEGSYSVQTYGKGYKHFSDKELNKVTKVDLSLDKLEEIIMTYKKEEVKISIAIDLRKYHEQHYILETNDSEKITIDGEEYYLIKYKETDLITGIFRKISIDGRTYYGYIRRMGEETHSVNIGDRVVEIPYSTKEEIIEIIRMVDIEEIIKQMEI